MERDGKEVDLSLLLDIPLQVTVELGRTRMTIGSLLRLTQGSVVELNRVAGEPLDIYVNNKLMARGEAVVVKEKFGVRITDVLSPDKRLENLQ
jgi:flagellar motor switch protein FliN/FliY